MPFQQQSLMPDKHLLQTHFQICLFFSQIYEMELALIRSPQRLLLSLNGTDFVAFKLRVIDMVPDSKADSECV